MHTKEKIEGIVKTKNFYDENNNFYYLTVLTSKTNKIKVSGTGSDLIKINDCISANGVWEKTSHGSQFKADLINIIKPTKKETILEYLSSGIIKGLSKKNAIEIVRLWGEDSMNVLDNYPERLLRLNGIAEGKLAKIIKSWEEVRPSEQSIGELVALGFNNYEAIKIYQKFGLESLTIARSDPYLIHRRVHSIPFEKVDEISLKIGILPDSPKRILATLEHFLKEEHKSGECLISYDLFFFKCIKYLKISNEKLFDQIKYALDNNIIYYIEQDEKQYVQYKTIKNSEEEIARRLFRISSNNDHKPNADTVYYIQNLKPKNNEKKKFPLGDEQKVAVFNCINNKVSILTGKPGTGKTTTLTEVIDQLKHLGKTIMLAAPTGRAAQRMHESTGLKASTIHRLLEFNPRAGGFIKNESNPLEADVIIIDESSMIDVYLMAHLLRAISNSTQIIIVGDVNQLPSVQAGSVLRDLINSCLFVVSRLNDIHRQGKDSKIITNAHAINDGIFDFNYKPSKTEDFFFIRSSNDEETLNKIEDIVNNKLFKAFNLNPKDQLQILAVQHEGLVGTKVLNEKMQNMLNNNDGFTISKGKFTYKKGDKVIQIINNYDKNVYNGDCGVIDIINHKGIHVILDNGLEVEYDQKELDQILPSYCITIHKSQGSEYPAIIIPLPQNYMGLIDRSLIYTGITRGKVLVIVIGSENVMRKGIASEASRFRKTNLKNVLNRLFEENKDISE